MTPDFQTCVVLMIGCHTCGDVRVLMPALPSKRFRCPICKGRKFLEPVQVGAGVTRNPMPHWEPLGREVRQRYQLTPIQPAGEIPQCPKA